VIGLTNNVRITELLQHYNIHPLVIEDILNTEQRPKIDYFDDYSFIVVKIQLNKRNFVQFSFILLDKIIISLQDTDSNFFTLVEKILATKGTKARQRSVDYLLLDSLVDNQFTVVESVENKVDDLEERFLKDQQSLSLPDI
jgi:magnesium transporter